MRGACCPPCASAWTRCGPGETGIVVTHGACLQGGAARGCSGGRRRQSPALRGMDNCGWAVLGEHEIAADFGWSRTTRPPRSVSTPTAPRGRFRHRRGGWLRFRELPDGSGRGCGAAGSAPAWHAGGQGFESPQLHDSSSAHRRTAVQRGAGALWFVGTGRRAQLVAALLAWHAGGQGFESPQLHRQVRAPSSQRRAQLVAALLSACRGSGFESPQLHEFARLRRRSSGGFARPWRRTNQRLCRPVSAKSTAFLAAPEHDLPEYEGAMSNDTGDRVRVLRTARGIAQADLAASVGVSKSYLSHIEAGRRPISHGLAVQAGGGPRGRDGPAGDRHAGRPPRGDPAQAGVRRAVVAQRRVGPGSPGVRGDPGAAGSLPLSTGSSTRPRGDWRAQSRRRACWRTRSCSTKGCWASRC